MSLSLFAQKKSLLYFPLDTDSEATDEEDAVSLPDEVFDEMREQALMEREFEILEAQYPSLFFNISSQFRQLENNFFFDQPISDVKMDNYTVVPISQSWYLGTEGVACCHAICAQGVNNLGEKFIGLAHTCIDKPKDVLSKLEKAFLVQGCSKESIQMQIIGGILSPRYTCLDLQKEYLNLATQFSITEVKLNTITEESDKSFDIVDRS